MLGANVWRRMLGVDRRVVIEDVEVDEEAGEVVVHVRPGKAALRALRGASARL